MNFLKRLWKYRIIRIFVWLTGSLVTVYVLACAWINYAGGRKWQAAQELMKREGEKLEFRALMPDPVPEEKNFCATPALKGIAAVVDHDEAKGDPGAKRKRLKDTALPSGKESKPKQAAGAALGKLTDLKAWADWMRKEGSLVVPPDSGNPAKDVLAGLSKHEVVFAELAEGLDRPEARWTPEWKSRDLPENLFVTMVPQYGAAQAVGTSLSLRSIAEGRAGDFTKAHQDILVELRLARASLEDPFLIGVLVGYVQQANVAGDVWELCEAHAGSAEDFRRLQQELSRFDARAAVLHAFRGEMASSAETLLWMNRVAGSHFLETITVISPMGEPNRPNWFARALWSVVPRGWMDMNVATIVDLEFNHVIKPLRDKGLRAALEEGAATETELKNRRTSRQLDSILACLMLPATTPVISRAAYTAALNNQTIIACALERWYLEHKSYPDSLEELKREGESPLPGDPMSGGPMHYRRTADGHYALWSVGFDGKDDGGKRMLDPKKLDSTRFSDPKYKGDWVWSFQPGE